MLIRAVGKIALACALALSLWTGSAEALSLQKIGSFDEPIFVTSDPGNPDRLFVVERQGVVVQVENGVMRQFANLSSKVGVVGEGGLLSIALSPDFDQSGRFYVDYTDDEGQIHVAEMRATNGGASLSSLRNLLTIAHPEDSNHYGGQLQFGPEGDLFVSTGDGGGSDDQHHNSQNLSSLLGKILRIDPDPDGLQPYTVPAGNPFAESPAPYDTIWAYGLRNPFRFSFDRLSGALLIGDVGQDAREEVDYAPAPGLGSGANYGWNCREGFIAGPETDEGCKTAPADAFTEPIFDYPHENPEDGGAFGCAIIGGYVARGPGLGDLYGRYVYGDLCTGQIRSLLPALPLASGERSEHLDVENLNSFGEDSCGRLYAVSGNGPVYRLVGSGNATCPTSSPKPQPLTPSFVGIRKLSHKVVRHRRVLIGVFVAPCTDARRGDPVSLWRGRALVGTRHLDRVCSARFRPRIDRRSGFHATTKAEALFEAAISRKLTIKPQRLRRHGH